MHSANRAKQRLQKRTSAEAKNEAEKRLNFESAERRSKSLERKGRIKNARNQNIQKLSNSSAASTYPGSDSGLSGLDPAFEKKNSPSPNSTQTESIVDSGRRSQSLEVLSDDLRSMTLSTPSSPSPRPSTGNKGHVHFLSTDVTNHAEIVRNMVAETELGALRKSNSIPVHLTVSGNNEVGLPPGLRPHNPTIHCPVLEHEPDCATYKKKWASAQNVSSNRRGPGTPTGETVSSLQKKKQRVINNGYSSLPRTPRERLQASEAEVCRSRSSASLSRPPSVASNISSSSRKGPKTMNASMSIWQIQKELKRGEMVQGVLHLGTSSFGRPSFRSRIQEREEETCICAPVVIGEKNGQMEWKRM